MLPDRNLDDLLDGLVTQIERLTGRVDRLENLESRSAWINYAAVSTIKGWSSLTTKQIYYKRLGKLVFVKYYLQGTSDDIVASFTVPDTISNTIHGITPARVMNNGAWGAAWGVASILAGTNICNLYTTTSGAGWTNSGDKRAHGEFWYVAA